MDLCRGFTHSAGKSICECQQNSLCRIAERVGISSDPSDMHPVRGVSGCFGSNNFHFLKIHVTVGGGAVFGVQWLKSGRYYPIFRKYLLSPTSGQKMKVQDKRQIFTKCPYICSRSRVHDFISQKAAMIMNSCLSNASPRTCS